MILNNQPIEKVIKSDGRILDVHSIFLTIQGEGPFSGTPAIFVRLAGCQLKCPLCDTDYTSNRSKMAIWEILDRVKELANRQTRLVVITGGEPFRQSLGPLFRALEANSFYVQVETNGALEPPDRRYENTPAYEQGVHIVCSPKTGFVHKKIWSSACCVKYVLSHDSVAEDDGLPIRALGHVANPRLARPPSTWRRPIYIQPADHQDPTINELNIRACVKSAIEHGYVLQLQIHKYLGVA